MLWINNAYNYGIYLGPSADIECTTVHLAALSEPNEIHNDGVDGGYEEGDVGAIVLRPVDPSDLIAAHVFRALRITLGFETDGLALDKDARVVHGDDGAVDGFGPLFAHEIIYDADAVLIQIANHTLAYVY